MSAGEVRYHSSDDMSGLPELSGVMEPVAVVIRPDGSVDAYGYIGVVDQRQGSPAEALRIGREYGQIDGDHHKTWVIDQMMAALTGQPPSGRGIAP